MARPIEDIEKQWRQALEEENAKEIASLAPEILKDHTQSALACELYFHRGNNVLVSGEGFGTERLARAINEFKAGSEIGAQLGEAAEPWRSLTRSQLGTCLYKLGNIQGAIAELKAVADYRPRSSSGMGALHMLTEFLQEDYPRDAKRYEAQKLSYIRAMIRESTEPSQTHFLKYILAQELLANPSQAFEGKKLIKELATLTEDELGEDLFGDVQNEKTQRNL